MQWLVDVLILGRDGHIACMLALWSMWSIHMARLGKIMRGRHRRWARCEGWHVEWLLGVSRWCVRVGRHCGSIVELVVMLFLVLEVTAVVVVVVPLLVWVSMVGGSVVANLFWEKMLGVGHRGKRHGEKSSAVRPHLE